jgi:hypothetical protein
VVREITPFLYAFTVPVLVPSPLRPIRHRFRGGSPSLRHHPSVCGPSVCGCDRGAPGPRSRQLSLDQPRLRRDEEALGSHDQATAIAP